MNYLDLLNDDNMDMIFKYITDDLEDIIMKLRKTIKKMKVKLIPLSINYFPMSRRYDIRYDKVIYSMDNFLFDNLYEEDILDNNRLTKPGIVIIKQFNEYFSNGIGMTFRSNKLKSPTYLDILIEANKAVMITDDYHNIFLKGIVRINDGKLLNYFNIRPNKYINYYEFIIEQYD
jgi:hypothetical protein